MSIKVQARREITHITHRAEPPQPAGVTGNQASNLSDVPSSAAGDCKAYD
jgi:hypothetical protein